MLRPLLLGFLMPLTQWVKNPCRDEGSAIQPRVTRDTEKLACQCPIRGEFLNSAETGIQFLAMKCHILLFWLNYLLSSFHIKIMNIEILIMFYHCFKSSPSHFSFTGLYIPILKYQFHGILQGQLIHTKDFTKLHLCFLPPNSTRKIPRWLIWVLPNEHLHADFQKVGLNNLHAIGNWDEHNGQNNLLDNWEIIVDLFNMFIWLD